MTKDQPKDELLKTNEELAQESKKLKTLEVDLEQVKEQHLKIARLLQSRAITAMQQNRANIYRSKEALDYLKEGVELERKVLGINEETTPAIVNIISQQQGVFDKYVKNDE